MRRRETVFSVLAVLGSVLGGAGLILLSIFDTKRHPSLHRVFLLLFMVGVALSAFFTCIEVCLPFSVVSRLTDNLGPLVSVDKQGFRISSAFADRIYCQGPHCGHPGCFSDRLCCRPLAGPECWSCSRMDNQSGIHILSPHILLRLAPGQRRPQG